MKIKLEIIESSLAIWRILPRYAKRQFLILIGFIAIATLLEALGLGMIIPFLGALIPSGLSGSSSGSDLISRMLEWFAGYSLQVIVLGLLFLFVLKNSYLAFLAYFQAKFVFKLEADLSKQLLANYLGRPYSFFVERNSAQLIRNLVGEISNFCHNALTPLCGLIAELLVALGILTLLIAVNPYGALIMAAALGMLGGLFHWRMRRHVGRWGQERQFHEGKRLQKLQESFGALKEIKIGGLQSQFCSDYARHAEGCASTGRRLYTVQSLPRLLLEVLAVLALVLAVLLVQDTQRAAIVPILGLYAAAAFRLMPSANRILNALQAIRFATPSIDLLSREFAAVPEPIQFSKNSSLSFESLIALRNVSFRYSAQNPPVFESVNLEIEKGEVVCLVGSSGAGKSTLVDVLCGLLSPSSGQVLVDGQKIEGREYLWHKHIAYVPQSIFLVDGTIKENIALGVAKTEIDEHRLKEVVNICGLEEMVRAHPDGLEAMVGERGARVSGGQRQRIGLAREIYRSRDVLVLDEATNALDASTEAEVVANISRAKSKMTIIWITHGTTPLRFADKLITVQAGGVKVERLGKKEKH